MGKKSRKSGQKQNDPNDNPRSAENSFEDLFVSFLMSIAIAIVAIIGGSLVLYASRKTASILHRDTDAIGGRGGLDLMDLLAEADLEPTSVKGIPPELQPADMFKVKPLMDSFRELWGTWRPHLYFGVRTAMPPRYGNPVFGIGWIDAHALQKGKMNFRHVCEQHNGVKSYAWRRHNGRDFGFTRIIDKGDEHRNPEVSIDATYIGQGAHWSASFDVNVTHASIGTLFVMYVIDESGGAIQIKHNKGIYEANGESKALGKWKMEFILNDHGPKEREERITHWSPKTKIHLHNVTEELESGVFRGTFGKQNHYYISLSQLSFPEKDHTARHAKSNMAAVGVRIGHSLSRNVSIDVALSILDPGPRFAIMSKEALKGEELKEEMRIRSDALEKRVNTFLDLGHRRSEEDHFREMAIEALSNMMGGIGYFYGAPVLRTASDSKLQSQNGMTGPLLTSVPSRPTFPRGFLWDEGFHQLLIWKWDGYISLTIMAHWLDLMTESGWIPREQILGEEAARKVPPEFIAQDSSGANPPTLLLALSEIAEYSSRKPEDSKDSTIIISFFKFAYPRLMKWVLWYNVTQSGPVEGSFRWRGREKPHKGELNPKTLTSGLDDYPRASHPSSEAKLMAKISSKVGALPRDVQFYEDFAKRISNFDHINELHLDPKTGRYFDWGNHSDGVELKRHLFNKQIGSVYGKPQYKVTQLFLRHENPDIKPKPSFVRHFGYVSLFPFIMKLIPRYSKTLEKVLDDLKDPKLLWTPYGLRSIAKSSSFYMAHNTEHDGPYWRGPIWINMNYLTLGALRHYSYVGGPFASKANDIYQELRRNILDNLFKWYNQTGFLWENYNSEEGGKGQGSHPFTGWTALVVLIYSEQYY